MDNLHISSLIVGAFNSCRNSLYIESPKAIPSKTIDQRAVLKFMIQLEAAYKYQLSLKRAQRPKRKLPPVPKFEDSETHSEPQKKVQISSETIPQINALSKKSVPHVEIIEDSDDAFIQSDALSETIEIEEKNHEKSYVISQMDQMFTKKSAPVETTFDSSDKKDIKKFKKLEKCLVELIKKLEIRDASVPIYCKEFLEIVVPRLAENFNKKPFIAIAAAVLIFACYKAQYPLTTKQILEASESKETIVIKCFYSIKEILANRAKN